MHIPHAQALTPAASHGPPPLGLMMAELPRSAQETLLGLLAGPVLAAAPRGRGAPVLVLPGLLTGDAQTSILRWHLRRLGHDAQSWGLGTNIGPVDRLERRLGARVEALAQASGHTVTIVGWSLGGLYARALARRLPQHVRQVITLGSPFRQQHDRQVRANAVYRALSRWHVADSDLVVLDDADRPLQVPATSVYSRSDGIAYWETCIDVVSATAENVRVRASHFGLPAHPAVLFLVADRLAQPMDEWAPFQPPSALRSLYPTAG